MKQLHALFRAAGARLGWPGMLGLALLAAVAVFHVWTLAPQQLRLEDLRQERLQLRQRAKLAANAAPQAPAEKLAAFYAFFPPPKDLPELLEKIFGAAGQQALVLEQGEYRALNDGAGGLMRYQLTLPVRGSYPQIRKFVDRALAEVPALSLDSIQFERRKIGDATVDAKLRMVVYLGSAS